VDSGSLVKRPAGYVHQNSFLKQPSHCFNVEFSSHRLPFYLTRLNDYSVERGQVSNLRMWRILNAFVGNEPALNIECLLGDMTETQQTSKQASVHVQGWLRRIDEYLHTHFASAVSLQDLSNVAHVSPIYMIRAFKKHYGMTIGEYHSQIRVTHAVDSILRSDKTLSEIAHYYGFYDLSHMSNKVKLTFGVSPQHLRKNFKRFI
jgi:AraC-like DNA-binding protein